MVDPTTTNRNYAVPTHGSDVDTWDQPLNSNFALIDQNLGAVTTISVSNVNVTLNAAQYACGTIRLTGTITSSLIIVFPSGKQGWWTIDNRVTYSSAALYMLASAGSENVGIPPGETIDIVSDGTNVRYRNLGRVGSYMDLAVLTTPNWILAATPNPYINCDGGTFSSATYPVLALMLGGTTLPDLRGRMRATTDQGSGRLTTAGSGIDGSTIRAAGGAQNQSITQAQLPNVTIPVSTSGTISVGSVDGNVIRGAVVAPQSGTSSTFNALASGATSSNIASSGVNTMTGNTSSINGSVTQSSLIIMPPTMVGGITLIRAG